MQVVSSKQLAGNRVKSIFRKKRLDTRCLTKHTFSRRDPASCPPLLPVQHIQSMSIEIVADGGINGRKESAFAKPGE